MLECKKMKRPAPYRRYSSRGNMQIFLSNNEGNGKAVKKVYCCMQPGGSPAAEKAPRQQAPSA